MLTSHRALRRLLFVTAYAWGIASGTAGAAILDEVETRSVRIDIVPAVEDTRVAKDDSREGRMKPEGLIKTQWAGLSPEQREQMRNQVREHRQRSREEFHRDERRDAHRAPPSDPSGRQQRLPPDEREEFRQWMRERQGGGRNGRGRGQ